MNGLPKVCNTRADYEFIRQENITGWQARWRELLEGRFIVSGDELIEDGNAQVFRLGFKVPDVATAIGFTGLTTREIEWREAQPDRWRLVDGQWREIDGWADARLAAKIAEAKTSKQKEIQQYKCFLRDSGIVIDGVLFDTDINAGAAYTKMLVACLINSNYTIDNWKASLGQYVKMTKDKVVDVMSKIGVRESAITSKQKIKEAEMLSLASLEDIIAYDVSTGWD